MNRSRTFDACTNNVPPSTTVVFSDSVVVNKQYAAPPKVGIGFWAMLSNICFSIWSRVTVFIAIGKKAVSLSVYLIIIITIKSTNWVKNKWRRKNITVLQISPISFRPKMTASAFRFLACSLILIILTLLKYSYCVFINFICILIGNTFSFSIFQNSAVGAGNAVTSPRNVKGMQPHYLGKFLRQSLGEIWAKFGQIWTKFGQNLDKFGRNLSKRD